MNPKEDLRVDLDNLIKKYDGEKLWKEIVYLAVKKNPTIAQDVLLTIRDNRDERAKLKDPKYGTSDTKSMRHAMRWPESVRSLLMLADPDHFPMTNENNGEKTLKKLFKVFPEFFLVEKL